MARKNGKTTSAKKILVTERVRKALELRLRGSSLAVIARECGYNSEQAAYKAIKAALDRSLKEPAEELRTLEAQRLDRLLAGIWEHATQTVTPEDQEAYATLHSLLHQLAETAPDATQRAQCTALLPWLESLWKRARSGQLAAIDRVLTIMQRRAALLGLDKPFKHAETTPDGEALPVQGPQQGLADEFVLGVAHLLAQYGQLGPAETGLEPGAAPQ